jgi:hypothetical protein
MSHTYPITGRVLEPWQQSLVGYIQSNQNQHSWIQNLRAKTQRFDDPRCFEAWKISVDIEACFSSYAHVSRTIWLNFTQEIKKSSNYKKMNWNRRFEDSMTKTSSRQPKWIYGTHDLELVQGSYGILKILQAAKSEGLVFTEPNRIGVKIVTVFGYDCLIRRKGYVQPPIYI